jgi:excinuclease ABC subunit C
LSRENPPDLFVVDGGKGHLIAVKRVLDAFFSPGHGPDVVALAKADERKGEKSDKIYLYGRKNPVSLQGGHPVLLLLMRVRDEAHRRAVAYHRKIRGKDVTGSMLEEIPGVGAHLSRRLLRHFGDMESVSKADAEEIANVPGIGRAAAEKIHRYFRSGDGPQES